jgi:Rad3-related DNA helicase
VAEKENKPEEIKTDLGPMLDIYPSIFGKDSEFRPQQVQYMSMCYEAVSNDCSAVIEGPTGLGKTRALLGSVIPLVLKDPEAIVAYSTRTNTR